VDQGLDVDVEGIGAERKYLRSGGAMFNREGIMKTARGGAG
jgi:hypothetical protein